MKNKLVFLLLLLMPFGICFCQDIKMAVIGGKNMPQKYDEEEAGKRKLEIKELYKTSKSKNRDSLITRNYLKICTIYHINNTPDSLLKYSEQFKKIAYQIKDYLLVVQAIRYQVSGYQHPQIRNSFKIHQLNLENLQLLSEPRVAQKYGIKGSWNYTVLKYFLDFYTKRDELQLAKQIILKYKSILHPDDFEELLALAQTGNPDPRFGLKRMQDNLLKAPNRPNYSISDLWMGYAFGAGYYNLLNMPDSAIIYAQKAYDISKMPNGNPFPVNPESPENLFNETLAGAYNLKKENEKADYYLKKALDCCPDQRQALLAYNINKALGNNTDALKYYEIYIKEKNIIDSLNRLKSVEYLQIGFETEKVKFESDQKQLVLKQKADSILNLKQLDYLQILNIKSNLENESILKSFSIQQLESKSIIQSLENDKVLSKSQLQNNQIKTLKLNELKQQIEFQNRTRNILGLGILILSLLGISLLWYNRKLKSKNVDLVSKNEIIKDITYKIQTTEITALRAQMNPHFIFNCLNSIKLYSLENDSKSASDYLSKFSKLIRLVLDNSRSNLVTLENDLETLQLYIEMEVMRFKQKVNFEIIVSSEIDQQYIEIPPLLIQPFVENAIWHGLMHKELGGKVLIHVCMISEDMLEVQVVDNGIGRIKSAEFKSKTATRHKSFGLDATNDRIGLINQTNNTNAKIIIEDLVDINNIAQGTKVIIQIPI